MGEINFTITEEHLETGMRGYPVGYCTTSSVDPYKGLCYLGKEISEFRDKAPESVIYLLYYGKEGSDDQIAEFKKELVKRAHCSAKLIEQIELLPREAHPMKMFSAAILLAGVFEGTGDYREDCLNLIAKIPVITAYMINHHAGWQTVNKSQPELGYIENFCHLLNIPQSSLASVDQDNLVTVFKLFNILHYDHGGGNLSTFVGKAVASGLEDMYGSICAAMCALAGPRHGKANQDCLQFVQSLQKEVEAPLTLKKVEQVIRDKLAKKELIFGFGHAVLRVEDARATLFYDFAQKQYPEDELVKTALLLREAGSLVLKENQKVADPYPNVDAISGVLLSAAGFPYPEYYTVLFGMARAVGISRQIVYERTEARNEKGTPIVRPKYIFKLMENNNAVN